MQTSVESMRVGRFSREVFWNPPNVLTFSRIAACPILLFYPFFNGPVGSAVFGIGFLLIALTDLLDGYLARSRGMVTRLGKLLDPLADKLLVTTALVVLVAMENRIPLWALPMVVAILGRELAVTGLRAMASAEGVVIAADRLGKWKTGFQTAAITCLFLHHEDPVWNWILMHWIGMFLLFVATVLAVWSGYAYFAAYLGAREEPVTR